MRKLKFILSTCFVLGIFTIPYLAKAQEVVICYPGAPLCEVVYTDCGDGSESVVYYFGIKYFQNE